MAVHPISGHPLNHAPEVKRFATCRHCGDDKLCWYKSRKTGKQYLADVQQCIGYRYHGRYFALAMRPHFCGDKRATEHLFIVTYNDGDYAVRKTSSAAEIVKDARLYRLLIDHGRCANLRITAAAAIRFSGVAPECTTESGGDWTEAFGLASHTDAGYPSLLSERQSP